MLYLQKANKKTTNKQRTKTKTENKQKAPVFILQTLMNIALTYIICTSICISYLQHLSKLCSSDFWQIFIFFLDHLNAIKIFNNYSKYQQKWAVIFRSTGFNPLLYTYVKGYMYSTSYEHISLDTHRYLHWGWCRNLHCRIHHSLPLASPSPQIAAYRSKQDSINKMQHEYMLGLNEQWERVWFKMWLQSEQEK